MEPPREDAREQHPAASSSDDRPPPADGATAAPNARAPDAPRAPPTDDDDDDDDAQTRPRLVAIVSMEGGGGATVLEHLASALGEEEDFVLLDSADLIEGECGGLDAVRAMGATELGRLRRRVTARVRSACRRGGASGGARVGVVAGHLSLLDHRRRRAQIAMTFGDVGAYDLCLYAGLPDGAAAPPPPPPPPPPGCDAETLAWLQACDADHLRRLCLDRAVLCEVLPPGGPSASSSLAHVAGAVLARLRDFREHDEQENLRRVLARVDEAIGPAPRRAGAGAVVVVDADKVLAGFDARLAWWEACGAVHGPQGAGGAAPYRQVLSHELWRREGRSYKTLRQLAHVFESRGRAGYDGCCQAAARAGVPMRDEILRLLYRLEAGRTPTLLVTSGLGAVWERTMRLPLVRLGDHVRVVGGGRLSDGFVVTSAARAAVVRHLREQHGLRVHALGMGEEDVPMLQAAGPGGILVAVRRGVGDGGDGGDGGDEVDEAVEAAVERARIRPRRLVLASHFDGGSSLDGEVLPGALPEVGDGDTEPVGDVFDLLDPSWE